MVGGSDIKQRVLGVRPVSMIPSGAFLPLPPGPTRRMLGPPPQLNSHGNYLLRTYSEKSSGISDHNQFIQHCIVKFNILNENFSRLKYTCVLQAISLYRFGKHNNFCKHNRSYSFTSATIFASFEVVWIVS